MHLNLLEILRCPFCGTRLTVVDNQALQRTGERIEQGVLGCECCAFPVVAGIPVLIADDATRDAMHALEAGRSEEALFALLGLDSERGTTFRTLLSRGDGPTFKDAIEVLSPDAEGTYFIYRFSDPTYLMGQTVLEGIAQNPSTLEGRALDLCGGSGHLTRVLDGFRPAGGTLLADVFFWKLWLARRFTAPACTPVCCDANNPLPFARDTFSLVVLSDAFPYIWHKRLLADEMMRVAGRAGTIVMPHLHSSLGQNFSAGMTLTPEGYRNLFDLREPRLFSDTILLDDAIGRGAVDLSNPVAASRLDGEPSLTLIAASSPELFRRYEPRPLGDVEGVLAINPLYRVGAHRDEMTATLTFPTPEYEEEFAECKRYLAPEIRLPATLSREALGERYEALRRRRILLDVPRRYA